MTASIYPAAYPSPLVWFGIWETPGGLIVCGFHVWNKGGYWHGVYKTCTRATAEAHRTMYPRAV